MLGAEVSVNDSWDWSPPFSLQMSFHMASRILLTDWRGVPFRWMHLRDTEVDIRSLMISVRVGPRQFMYFQLQFFNMMIFPNTLSITMWVIFHLYRVVYSAWRSHSAVNIFHQAIINIITDIWQYEGRTAIYLDEWHLFIKGAIWSAIRIYFIRVFATMCLFFLKLTLFFSLNGGS